MFSLHSRVVQPLAICVPPSPFSANQNLPKTINTDPSGTGQHKISEEHSPLISKYRIGCRLWSFSGLDYKLFSGAGYIFQTRNSQRTHDFMDCTQMLLFIAPSFTRMK